MKLEFADGRQIEVIAIYGGPRLIQGSMRDTLRIEVNPSLINFDNLKALFMDSDNLSTIYSITESTNETGDMVETKSEIGEGYTLFVSISDEVRNIAQIPGKLEPPTSEEIYTVTIAQETYAEHQLKLIQFE